MTGVIIEKQLDELTIERFEFYQTENKLYLDKYFIMKRESTRKRNYNTVVRYDRLRQRDNTITEAEVPFTDEIKALAIKQYVDSIKCLKWSEK
jgi:hypothetical protein